MKKHEKNAAKWIAIGIATVMVLLAIVFHEYVFDMLEVMFDWNYWSFWGITWPIGIFLIDSIRALWDKGFFTRNASYWKAVCQEFLFLAILHLLSSLTPLIMMVVLGVYFSPAMGIREITTEASALLKETYPDWFALSLPFVLVTLPLIFGFPAILNRRPMDGDGAFEWREGELSKDERIEKIIARLNHCPSHSDVTMFHPQRLSQI